MDKCNYFPRSRCKLRARACIHMCVSREGKFNGCITFVGVSSHHNAVISRWSNARRDIASKNPDRNSDRGFLKIQYHILAASTTSCLAEFPSRRSRIWIKHYIFTFKKFLDVVMAQLYSRCGLERAGEKKQISTVSRTISIKKYRAGRVHNRAICSRGTIFLIFNKLRD